MSKCDCRRESAQSFQFRQKELVPTQDEHSHRERLASQMRYELLSTQLLTRQQVPQYDRRLQ
jgi:hypothetical protein